MFEAILERLLKRILGEYFEGFDSSNLGVGLWSGNVTIQNVRLKASAMSKLGLPLLLKYSFIRSLRLKIPWKSLTSSKIEIYLDGLYVIVGSQPEKDWVIRDAKLIERRRKEVDSYAEQIMKKYDERRNTKEEESGFTDRLLLRMIDNLQVQVSDIHIRFEDGPQGYAFGLSLENFKLMTVNKDGKDEFIDRSKPEFRNQPLRKRLDLVNLGIYWSSRAVQLEASNDQYFQQAMSALVQKSTEQRKPDYLILISSEAKLFQRNKGNFEAAETTLEVSIKQLMIDLQNRQVQQMITLSERLQRFQDLVRESNRVKLQESVRQKNLQDFGYLYRKYLSSEQTLEADETTRYEAILEKMETQEFAKIIREEIKEREKKKIISTKQVKKFAWISYGRKELSETELAQVEKFLKDNFSEEEVVVTRPKDYSYIEARLFLQRAVFTVGRREGANSQGVELSLSQLATVFRKRETGYLLTFELADLALDLFRREESHFERQKFFYKMGAASQKYVDIKVNGNPPNRPEVDTELTIKVDQSFIVFTPVFVTRLQRFIDLKVNQSNKDKAREKIGEIKDMTSESLASSLENTKIKVIALDIVIKAPVIVLPFEAGSEGACWCVDTGMLQIWTDPVMLDPSNKPTFEKYTLALRKMSLSWFQTKRELLESKHNQQILPMETLIKDFEVELDISLLRNNKDKTKGNVVLQGRLPLLDMALSSYGYRQLLELGICFEDRLSQPMLVQPKPSEESKKELPVEKPSNPDLTKKQIMSGSQKIGLLHLRSPTTKLWDRYFCILNGNFIYLFADKTSETCSQSIFIRNSKLQDLDEELCGKANAITLSNRVNKEVVLCADKKQAMDQWRKLILAKKDEQQESLEVPALDEAQAPAELKKKESAAADYQQLKVEVQFEVSQVQLNVFEKYRENSWLRVHVGGLALRLSLYEARKQIRLLLKELSLADQLEEYANPELRFLLQSRVSESLSQLVAINILQVDERDPGYSSIDNDIQIKFGLLFANFKPRTIAKLMEFFLPPKKAEQEIAEISRPQEKKTDKLADPTASFGFGSIAEGVLIAALADVPEVERVGVRLKLSVGGITLNLVNRNNRLKHGWIDIRSLQFQLKRSDSMMELEGSLKKLRIADSSGYPETILSQSEYTDGRDILLIDTSMGEDTELLDFNIKLLEHVQPGEKKILIRVLIKDLVVDYFQQPILRLLHYLLQQMLPSLQQQQDQALRLRKPEVTPPQETDFFLNVSVLSSRVMLRCHPLDRKQMLCLNIGCIEVQNSDSREQYCSGEKQVAVANYRINISGLEIAINERPLTNDFNFMLTVSMVQSPEFYKFSYPGKFQPGMRISCRLSPFLLRIDNPDYKFIMKCLNCNIAFDDNCDPTLFPEKFEELLRTAHLKAEQKEPDDPLYFQLRIDILTVAVTQQLIPISNLTLSELEIGFTSLPDRMRVTVGVADIIGSSFREQDDMYEERGIIKQLDVKRIHNKKDLVELKDLVRLFYVSQSAEKKDRKHQDLSVLYEQYKNGDSLTEITLDTLSVSLQLRPLLKLSKLATLDDSVKPPAPRLPPTTTKVKSSSENHIRLIANALSFRAATEHSGEQLGISGQFFFDLTTKPTLTKQQVAQQCRQLEIERLLENGRMSLTVNYLDIFLLEVEGGRLKRRVLLNPTNIILAAKKSYSVMEDKLLLTDEYIVKLEYLYLEATIKDLIKLKALYAQAMGILAEDTSRQPSKEPVERMEKSIGSDGESEQPENNAEFKQELMAIASSSQTIQEMRAEVNIREVKVEILYESSSIFIPVLQLQLLQTNPIFKSNVLLQQLSLVTYTELSFFNPRSSKWEPILQKNSFTIEYVTAKKETGAQTTIGIQCGNDPLLEKLNINVSSQFLTSLAEVLSELKKQDDLLMRRTEIMHQSQLETQELEVSPYVIENLTFEEIQVNVSGAVDNVSSLYQSAAAKGPRTTVFDRNRTQQKEAGLTVTKIFPPQTRRSVDIPPQVREIKIRLAGSIHSVLIDGFAKRRIGSTNYIVDCRVERLNRLIRVVGETIMNCTTKDITVSVGRHQQLLKPNEQMPLMDSPEFFVSVPGKPDLRSEPIVKEDMYVVTPVHCKHKYHYNVVKEEEEVGGMILQNYKLHSPLKLVNCLPKPLQLQVLFHNKTTANKELKSQQEYEIHSHAKGEEIRMKISLPNCFWSHEVSIAQNVEKEVDMTLKDALGSELVIRALVTKDEDSHAIAIAFFCQAYIINESPFHYVVYGVTKVKGEHSKRLAGQLEHNNEQVQSMRSLVIVGYEADSYIKLAAKACPEAKSDKIFIGGIDSSEVQLQLQQSPTDKEFDRAVQLGVQVSVKQMHKDFSLLCKEVRVIARQVIVNHTNQLLTMRQEGEVADRMLEPNERVIMEYRKGKDRKMMFRLPNTQLSSPIAIENLGISNFYVQDSDAGKVFMRVDTQVVDGFVIMVVTLQKPEQVPYMIRNRTKELLVEVQAISERVLEGGATIFSWKDPQLSHTLELKLVHRGSEAAKFVEINPDRVGSKQRLQFQLADKSVLYVTVCVVIVGDRRTIEIRSKSSEEQEQVNSLISTLGVKVATISLSLVLNHGSIARPYEAFNITLLDLEFMNERGTLEQSYQLRLRFLQIDQNQPHLLAMPVVITPSKFKQFMAKDSPRSIINLLIKRNMQSTRSVLLSEVALEINPLTIRVSELFIKLILELLREFTLALNTKQEEYLVKRNDVERWKQVEVSSSAVPIYIQQIRISPIDLDISAQLKPPDNGQKQFIMVEMVLKGFGVVVANIDEAPIRLRGIEIKGCFDSPAGISQKLMIHYKKNVIMEIYKLFGSFNALGNPASLFSNIATGLTDLVEKPAQGFVKGPLELGRGIVEGAHSLVAHTVGGAFNSVSKITGTISSGLALLAFDKNFEAMRENQKRKKPKNIIQGLEKGARAIYSGFKEGMTGIFLRPYEQAKKDGVLGFFRGTAQGLAGIIIKPVTGVLDFAADTTQGIKNSALYFQDKPNENRMRCPRVFYGRTSELREFVVIDSEINNILQVVKKGRFASSYFLQAFMIEGRQQLLAVLDDYLVLLSFRNKKTQWFLPLRTVKSIRQEPDGLKLNLSQHSKYFDTDIGVIQSTIPEQQEIIRQLIEEQMKYQRR